MTAVFLITFKKKKKINSDLPTLIFIRDETGNTHIILFGLGYSSLNEVLRLHCNTVLPQNKKK